MSFLGIILGLFDKSPIRAINGRNKYRAGQKPSELRSPGSQPLTAQDQGLGLRVEGLGFSGYREIRAKSKNGDLQSVACSHRQWL